MTKLSNKFTFPVGCPICGKHIGRGFDHSACSKQKKELSKLYKLKTTTRRLTEKCLDYFSKS